MEHFDKSPQELREETYKNVEKIDDVLHSYSRVEPKPLQKKVPFYIATFSTKESIEFAAKHGYGLMFSQGATIEECDEASLYYHSLAGFYPEAVVMRIFSIASSSEEARQIALPATDYFVKCMQALKAKKKQPKFFEENYQQLLQQRYEFFDAKKFMKAGIIGTDAECIEQIQELKSRVQNLHLVLKVASSNAQMSKDMLRLFSEKIEPKI
jgi:alkanesulfonate monooxygenase SsuD/methylene tetrahydromethanopterin reductase-like flavin-dependent oxidoreductase (luciferase family)